MHPALSLVGQVGQEEERAQEVLPLGLQELHSKKQQISPVSSGPQQTG